MDQTIKRLQKYSPLLLAYSLALVFFVFGILKVFDISPVKEFVLNTSPLFTNDWLFRLLGLVEVCLGVALIPQLTRKWAALGIVLHLGGIFLVSLLNPALIFSWQTLVTFHGEFVMKNLVLIAVASHIFADEHAIES